MDEEKKRKTKTSSAVKRRYNAKTYGAITDRKSTRLNSSHITRSRMPSSA